MSNNKLNGYELTRIFFDWYFENPEKMEIEFLTPAQKMAWNGEDEHLHFQKETKMNNEKANSSPMIPKGANSKLRCFSSGE